MRSVQKIEASLIQVGLEVFPVYGCNAKGWSTDSSDIGSKLPVGALYGSVDELFFALVNLNISEEGQA